MRSSLLAALLAALFILAPLPAAAAPVHQEYGPQPQSPARFLVELPVHSGAEAATLARLLPEWDDALAAADPEVRASLRREAELLAAFKR